MPLAIGQRVRTLIDLTSAAWAPEQPDMPAGALGTVGNVFYEGWAPVGSVSGYGVMLDDSVDHLAVLMAPADIEPST